MENEPWLTDSDKYFELPRTADTLVAIYKYKTSTIVARRCPYETWLQSAISSFLSYSR